jgi:hypothetical protein
MRDDEMTPIQRRVRDTVTALRAELGERGALVVVVRDPDANGAPQMMGLGNLTDFAAIAWAVLEGVAREPAPDCPACREAWERMTAAERVLSPRTRDWSHLH